MKPPLIVILGPTASGKSELAIKLAKFFNGEIISADSRQVYKEMNIATNKYQISKIKNQNDALAAGKQKIKSKKPIIIKQIPHYLIDIVKPNQIFTAAQFKQKAINIIKKIQKRGKIPFLVGGTGLYISAIADNLEIPQIPPDEKLRQKLEKEIEKYGVKKAYQKLLKLDPRAKNFVQEKNSRRIIRALEICLITGKKFSELRKRGKSLFNVLQIGIKISRKTLYKKINERVEKMIKDGLVDEVKNLAKKYPFALPSMSGIGYKQIGRYLKKEISLDEAIELIKRDTRRYVGKQMSWFKKHPSPEQIQQRECKKIKWIKKYSEAQKTIANFLSKVQ